MSGVNVMGGGLVGAAFLMTGLAGCSGEPPQKASTHAESGLVLLEQNWDDKQRDIAWYSSFGSRIVPLPWFLALERADGEQPFSSPGNLARFGFAQAGSSERNPHGLPIGLASTPPHQGRQWLGLGCSACHSGQIYRGGKALHIDGGQALVDFQLFEHEFIAALKATLADPAKFGRFAASVGEEPGKLKAELEARSRKLVARAELNATRHAYGRGRLDAFGQIFNAVTADFLAIPDNRREPDAPVSYPVLWDAPHLDLVQWNASAPNAGPGPLLQNATTALAVFGELDIHSDGLGYGSSIEVNNLAEIQNLWYRLRAPAWPEQHLGAIDRELAGRGQALYQANCQSCHGLAEETQGHRKLKATAVPVAEVGTDPTMAANFVNARAKSGAFEGKKLLYAAGPVLGAEASSIELVLHATVGALLHHPVESLAAGFEGAHKVDGAKVSTRPYTYKARPLSGIWASAPYLHNGSVPTLAALLSGQRPARFPVGKVEFDPVAVGLSSRVLAPDQVSWFDTAEPGNDNGGHRYGSQLSEAERTALLEYLKTL
ncbi:cytochrome c [Gallaecimonas sp. GXIMD4217]|uniref:cytochrome c n=1 Tax=Gallaecimonas sp. GXIMD4217 TaxID=3131927 RepID=UPI00311AC627